MHVRYFDYYATNGSYHARETAGYGVDGYVGLEDAKVVCAALVKISSGCEDPRSVAATALSAVNGPPIEIPEGDLSDDDDL